MKFFIAVYIITWVVWCLLYTFTCPEDEKKSMEEDGTTFRIVFGIPFIFTCLVWAVRFFVT